MKRTLLLVACLAALTGCATQVTPPTPDSPGFLLGCLHGFVSLFSLIGSFFWDVRVYASPNSGRWYDAGFLLGAAIFFGAMGGRASFDQTFALGYDAGARAMRSQFGNSN